MMKKSRTYVVLIWFDLDSHEALNIRLILGVVEIGLLRMR